MSYLIEGMDYKCGDGHVLTSKNDLNYFTSLQQCKSNRAVGVSNLHFLNVRFSCIKHVRRYGGPNILNFCKKHKIIFLCLFLFVIYVCSETKLHGLEIGIETETSHIKSVV